MNWFLYALVSALGWGFADLFYKAGTDENDRYSHLRIAVWVGLVMGVTALLLMPFSESRLTFSDIPEKACMYLPASLCYIISMVIGYAGLRYLELSIVSPIQNASGAFSVIVMSIYFALSGRAAVIRDSFGTPELAGTVLAVLGTVGLAVVENRLSAGESREAQEKTQSELCMHPSGQTVQSSSDPVRKYRYGALALLFPLLYCVFDTLGTAADGIILDAKMGPGLGEIDVLVLYGLTFFLAGAVCFFVLLAREKKIYQFWRRSELPKLAAALCEQFGQLFYVYAMAAKPLLAAPMIASYCIVSVILSRMILKEKLCRSQTFCVVLVVTGIVLLGISEGLAS